MANSAISIVLLNILEINNNSPLTLPPSRNWDMLLFFVFKVVGTAIGSFVSYQVEERLVNAMFLLSGVSMLILGCGCAGLPWASENWHVFMVLLVVGFVLGWADNTGNALLLRFCRKKSQLNAIQGTRLCYGLGAVLSPVLVFAFNKRAGKYDWSIWTISITACVSFVMNLSCSFVPIPYSKQRKRETHSKHLSKGKSSSTFRSNTTIQYSHVSTPLLATPGNYTEGPHSDYKNDIGESQNIVILFTCLLLFLFSGIHGSVSFWLVSWMTDFLPEFDYPLFLLSEYWLGFTISCLVLERIKIHFKISNYIILIFNFLSGTVLSGLFLLTGSSASVDQQLTQNLWLWICIPIFGISTGGLFLPSISIPNDNQIWIRPMDQTLMTIAFTLGDTTVPLTVGIFWHYSLVYAVMWTIFVCFALGIVLTITTALYNVFSKELAEKLENEQVNTTL
eukprot:TRINITY_DN12297_c0_g1_i1.p1 TRINITY_DN12297_c0_g1~~TRINITY_DN12297_c0_g1_i1.p1  ORF type:complete len:477 (+),score=40.62 TRINITY_DN12297_c0_g1_i1:84-1433(+)